MVLDDHPEYALLRNRPLEAQAFWKHGKLPPKLYESRKRRIRRLRHSRNFVEDVEDEGLRVVVCRSPSEGIERHCKLQGGPHPSYRMQTSRCWAEIEPKVTPAHSIREEAASRPTREPQRRLASKHIMSLAG
ncbi:uncharacterized protein PG986_004491 [Apiospora aurea]|uniref:Uncharacterized protein n=1 Tax=Apiospora aurea TaxID=335848 RepID=A0ABR1QN80_9PEZI